MDGWIEGCIFAAGGRWKVGWGRGRGAEYVGFRRKKRRRRKEEGLKMEELKMDRTDGRDGVDEVDGADGVDGVDGVGRLEWLAVVQRRGGRWRRRRFYDD